MPFIQWDGFPHKRKYSGLNLIHYIIPEAAGRETRRLMIKMPSETGFGWHF
ncbi:hypothetical protein OIG29_02825 [Neisseria meningitidis]|uniref:hypothetical protein n=1 Tax=Neisseria meningitidis TaxID=487 RepID=UPI0002FFC97D|nr:hypothetical protein [Neisseria meningitidis]MBG9194415.1 hypothetical protein [Neisseria meningitidis]MBH5763834.1 hypothetical protein [Neisseria meningitidis]MCL5897423.1 hypothetical protein [Neisseria meningitidis]MCL5915506.1 hypothetical protein [Neisseria meningitidis]MCV6777889.1 hypothetical protein [Neisseria meningitidis]